MVFTVIILLIFVFVLLLFEKRSAIVFFLDTGENDMHLYFSWLPPLLKAKIEIAPSPLLTVYLFHMRVYSKPLRSQRKERPFLTYRNALVLDDSYVQVYYSLSDPYLTGIACGIISIAQAVFDKISVLQVPDFIPGNDYIVLKAGAKLSIGQTLYRIARLNRANWKNKRRNLNGSVQYGRKRGYSVPQS